MYSYKTCIILGYFRSVAHIYSSRVAMFFQWSCWSTINPYFWIHVWENPDPQSTFLDPHLGKPWSTIHISGSTFGNCRSTFPIMFLCPEPKLQQYQLLIVSARKQFHYRKGVNFRIVHYKMTCGTSRIMPHFDPIWDKGSLQTYLLQISWLLQIAPVTGHGVAIFLKIFTLLVVNHVQVLTTLAFCR